MNNCVIRNYESDVRAHANDGDEQLSNTTSFDVEDKAAAKQHQYSTLGSLSLSEMCKSNTNTMDAATLLQQHGWRVAMIIGCLSLAIRSVLSSTTSLGYCGSVLATLICLYWLKNEVATVYQRKYLPPGDFGPPIIGETLGLLFNPTEYTRRKQEKFGDMYTDNTISLSVVFGNDKDISWLWNAERKGRAQGMWPPHIRALLGKGAVANTTGRRHRMLRRMLEPAFAPNATRDYVEVLDVCTRDSLYKWSATDSFHSSAEFKLFALRLFFIAGFGYVDEQFISQLHDDFSIWLSGFGRYVLYNISTLVLILAISINSND